MSNNKSPSVYVGKSNWLFLKNDSNNWFRYINKDIPLPMNVSTGWSMLIKNRIESLKVDNVSYFFLIAPSKEAVRKEFLPEGVEYFDPIRPTKLTLESILKGRYIDPTSELIKNKDSYLKGDTHWSQVGAYRAYLLLLSRMKGDVTIGRTILDNDFTWEEVKIKGDLSSKINGEDIITRVSKFKSTDKPKLIFNNEVNNTGNLIIFDNPDLTGDIIMIFRDSFMSAMMPFIARSFSKVILVWQPNIDFNLVNKYKPNIVLSEQTERFMVSLPDDSNLLSYEERVKLKGGDKYYESEIIRKDFLECRADYIELCGTKSFDAAFKYAKNILDTKSLSRFEISWFAMKYIELACKHDIEFDIYDAPGILSLIAVDEHKVRARILILLMLKDRDELSRIFNEILADTLSILPSIRAKNLYRDLYLLERIIPESYRASMLKKVSCNHVNPVKKVYGFSETFPTLQQTNIGSIPPRYRDLLSKGARRAKDIAIYDLKDVYLLSFSGFRFVFDSDFNLIPECSDKPCFPIEGILDISQRPVDFFATGGAAMLADHFGGSTYGHWLLDWVTRLCFYEYDIDNIASLIVRDSNCSFHTDVLDYLNFSDKKLLNLGENQLIKIDKLLVADSCFENNFHHVCHAGHPDLMQWWEAKIKPKPILNVIDSKRLFIPRVLTRKIQNESECFQLLEKYGFKKIEPSNYTFAEQVDIFRNAEVVVASHGAALANLLFMKNGSVLELFSSGIGTEAYALIADVNNNNYSSFCDAHNEKSNSYSSVSIDLVMLEKWLKKELFL